MKPLDVHSEPLSQTARDILEVFHGAHRRPGARMTITNLERSVGSGPAVAASISELVQAGYLATPDSGTVELTPAGFDHIQLLQPEQGKPRRDTQA